MAMTTTLRIVRESSAAFALCGASFLVTRPTECSPTTRLPHSFLNNDSEPRRLFPEGTTTTETRVSLDVFTITGRESHVGHASCSSRSPMRTSHRVESTDLERRERAMTPTPKQSGSFVVVNLDQVKPGIAEIQSVLESIDIPVEVVESGRQLRWSTAAVLRIPEHRIADAMLALGMKGFADVMAYQSNEVER